MDCTVCLAICLSVPCLFVTQKENLRKSISVLPLSHLGQKVIRLHSAQAGNGRFTLYMKIMKV